MTAQRALQLTASLRRQAPSTSSHSHAHTLAVAQEQRRRLLRALRRTASQLLALQWLTRGQTASHMGSCLMEAPKSHAAALRDALLL